MKNEGHFADFLVDSFQGVEGKACPVFGVLAVNIADACSKHGYAKVSNHLAFLGVCTFACAYNAVFFAADSANFCFKGDTQNVAGVNQSGGELNVFFDGVVRTVEHDGAETCVDASLCAFKCSVVEVKSNRNSDTEFLDHAFNHANDGGVTAHILACTLGYAEDTGSLKLLSGLKNALGPFQVVDVELADSIMFGTCLVEHFLC